jgi:hypothetical protein
MLGWGVSIACFGIVPALWAGLALLAVAGASDVAGTVFRMAVLQRRTPSELQGRLSGSFYAAAVAGNRVGDGESGAVASLAGAQVAVWSGGLACVVGTLLFCWRVPELWRGAPDPVPAAGPMPLAGPDPGAPPGPVPVGGASA